MTAIKRAVVTATTAVLVGAAGCGNQITMNYSWPVIGAQGISVQYDNGNGSINTWSSALFDKSAHTLAGTRFTERCDAPPRKNLVYPPVSCIVIINTGRQVYVGYSGNTPFFPDGTFRSLASSGSPDTIVVTTDPQSPPPPIDLHVSIHNNG